MPGGWKTFSGQSRHIHQPFSHQLLIPLQGISVRPSPDGVVLAVAGG
jgi:hypothetical protein